MVCLMESVEPYIFLELVLYLSSHWTSLTAYNSLELVFSVSTCLDSYYPFSSLELVLFGPFSHVGCSYLPSRSCSAARARGDPFL